MNKTSYIYEGHSAVTPNLVIDDASAAIEWYKNVFGAQEIRRMENPDKTILHAELKIGDALIFLTDENPQLNTKSPRKTNGNSIFLYVYVPDVDATIKKAQSNTGKVVQAPQDMFYGDRCAHIQDPFGFDWTVATHVKDVSEAEMKKGMERFAHEHAN
jgi:PhnB protein